MKSLELLAVVVVCGLASTAAGGVSVSVDGQVGEEVILKVGQSAVVWVSSDDGVPYSVYLGFDGETAVVGLGSPTRYTAAGNLSSTSAVSPPPITGYYLNAAGTSPAPSAGLHFHLLCGGMSEGTETLKLYDSTLSVVLQSVTIRVEGAAAGTGFTYQGRLLDEDKAASGLFDLRLELFEAPSAGNRIGGTFDLADVSVEDGYFTVRLDFGNVFGGQARWLQTSVRASGSSEDYTRLWPRQRLTAAPQATYAAWAGLAEHAVIASGVHWANVAGIPPAIANYAAPDVQAGFVPYYDGSRFVSSAIRSDGERAAVGTNINTSRKFSVYTNSETQGLYSVNARAGTGNNYAIYGMASGDTTGPSFGVYGWSSSNSGNNYGSYGFAGTPSPGINYGVYGSAYNSGSGGAYAGYFNGDVGITGILNQDQDLRIATNSGRRVAIGTGIDQNRKVNVYADGQTYAFSSVNAREGTSINIASYGAASGNTTANSYGVWGVSSSASGANYAVYGRATANSTGPNYGVYGYAINGGGGASYAGYFNGVTIMLGDVGVGTTNIPTGRRINTSTGAYLSTGGVWTNSSSRDWKENFEAVDGREVLERLVRVPVSTWNYKTEDVSVRHMGPVSQDLYAAFRLSGDDESISTVDTAGLSFAAIQGLYQVIEEKEAEIASVRRENEEIKNRLAAIESQLAALAGQRGGL
ncbi:MAG: hypothetical protein IH624_10030 [Phycisphaerae bacterium]|nr:hypothetical protein [Phycisphaerae bacterium]